MLKSHRILLALIALFCLAACPYTEPEEMSDPYAGNPANYPASITVPTGSDLKNVSTVRVPLEGVIDRTAYLADKGVVLPGTDRVEVPIMGGSASSHWLFQNGSGPMWSTGIGWLQTSVGSAGHVWLEAGAHLKYYQFQSILCYVKGRTSVGHSALTTVPSQMPQISFWRWLDPYRGQQFTADSGTDTLTAVAHGLTNGTPLRLEFLTTGGALPAGLAVGTTYYVIGATADTFQLSATVGGGAINFTTNGTGALAFLSVPEQVGSPGVDSSATYLAYDVSHFILLALASVETIDRRPGAPYPYARYFVKVEGESGVGAVANELILKSCRLAPGLFG